MSRPIKINAPRDTITLVRDSRYWTLTGPSGRHSFVASGDRADPLAHLTGYLSNNRVDLREIARVVALVDRPGSGTGPNVMREWIAAGFREAIQQPSLRRRGDTWNHGRDLARRLRPFLVPAG